MYVCTYAVFSWTDQRFASWCERSENRDLRERERGGGVGEGREGGRHERLCLKLKARILGKEGRKKG